MMELFQTVLYQPIFNGFVALYNLIPDVGVVILIVTILVKILLYPLTDKSIKAQRSLASLQPKMKELKEKHKDNQQVLAQETMKLYKEHKVNPLGSCLPLLIQLPIFIALYLVMRDGLAGQNFNLLYPFVQTPASINPLSLGLVNLVNPNIILAVLAGVAQFFQAKSMITKRAPKKAGEGSKDEDLMAMMNKQMLYVMPVLTVIIGFQLPGGLSLYWFISTVLTALQQYWVARKDKEKDNSDEGVIVS